MNFCTHDKEIKASFVFFSFIRTFAVRIKKYRFSLCLRSRRTTV